MRGRIRSGDGSGGGKRSGRRFGAEESALDRLLGRSVGPSLWRSHRQAIAFLCLDYCVQQSSPLQALPPPPPLDRTKPVAVVVWRKMGAMWWNGARVKYEAREEGERGGSSFLTF